MEEEPEVLYIPDIDLFGNWETLQQYLKRKGNPPYSIGGYLDLNGTPIKSFGNLTSVGGDLYGSPISKKYTEEEIRQMIDVRGEIYM